MEKTTLSGLKTIPSVPKASVPRVIGTELHFIENGKLFVGLLRECKEDRLIIQTGTSNIREVPYPKIIGFTPCKQFKHEFSMNISIRILKEENKTIVNCDSTSLENINEVCFHSREQKKKDWSKFTYAI